MKLEPASANRLLNFCSKLPQFAPDAAAAASDARFALECFLTRKREIQNEIANAAGNNEILAMLRCETEAVDSACTVINRVWTARFGTQLPNQ